MRRASWMLLGALTMTLAGCRGATAAVAGNLVSMVIAIFLMWSTLNLND